MLKQLYPLCVDDVPLQGAYLQLNLHKRAVIDDVFIYANYISSLDGRISLFDKAKDAFVVPTNIANPRDWRLYQELAGQSDVMLTSARYFRQLAEGKAQDLLPVGSRPDFADIKTWREQQGLKPQPDVFVLSNSLDIPLAAIDALPERKITVLTKQQTSQQKVKALESCGVKVLQTEHPVTGRVVRQSLKELGYRSAYMIAGPQVHQTLAVSGCIDELFLTSHLSLIGGQSFHTLLEGEMSAITMKLLAIYLDEEANQMFMRYQYRF